MSDRERAERARLRPEDRYMRDPHFHALVDVLENAIHVAQYTPTEIREAAMLAAIRYEMRRGMPPLRISTELIDPYRERVEIPAMGEIDFTRLLDQIAGRRREGE